jgi:hypothetical protein
VEASSDGRPAPAHTAATAPFESPSFGPAQLVDEDRSREHAKKCGPGSDRQQRWAVLSTLWRYSTNKRQAHCRRFATGEVVSIEKRAATANYSGLQTCASVWTCPCCGPKIAAERAADVALALTAHVADGGTVAMLTLTLPHARAQRLSDLLDGLGGAWAGLRANKTPRRLLVAHTSGWIKRLEVTWGPNGWHPHLHVLLFLKPGTTDAQLQAIAAAAYTAWSGRLIRAGLGEPSRQHGVDVKRLDLASAHEKVADYVAKSAAFELTSAGSKRARGENRTPMQLLADVTALGLADDLAAWHEYERATKGKQQLRWSDGLRARLIGDVPEISDDQAAESNDGAARLLGHLTAAGWQMIRRAGRAVDVLEWAEVHDDDDQAREHIARQLAAHQLDVELCPPVPPVCLAEASSQRRSQRPEDGRAAGAAAKPGDARTAVGRPLPPPLPPALPSPPRATLFTPPG